MVPCATDSNEDETICVNDGEQEEKCPIVDILMITGSEVEKYTSLGYQISE